MNMRLIGAQTMKDVTPNMVDTHALFSPGPEQTMYDANCKFCSLSGSPLLILNETDRGR